MHRQMSSVFVRAIDGLDHDVVIGAADRARQRELPNSPICVVCAKLMCCTPWSEGCANLNAAVFRSPCNHLVQLPNGSSPGDHSRGTRSADGSAIEHIGDECDVCECICLMVCVPVYRGFISMLILSFIRLAIHQSKASCSVLVKHVVLRRQRQELSYNSQYISKERG